MELRPYQEEAVQSLWSAIKKKDSALCVLPTGSGKTVIMSEIIKKSIAVKPDVRICVLFNKVDLLEQINERLSNVIESVGVYCGSLNEKDLDKTVVVGSIQSIHNIENHFFHLIIVDECHNLDEKSGRYIDFISSNVERNEKTKLIGFTATPFRASSGYIYGKDKIFDGVAFSMPMVFFIANGFLVPPILQSSKSEDKFNTDSYRISAGDYNLKDIENDVLKNKVRSASQVNDVFVRASDRKKIIWFCSTIKHAEQIHELILEKEPAAILHSKMTKEDRDKNKYLFEKTDCRHLIFITIVSEGFDYPPTDCIVMLRPTRSPVLYVQVVGRGLRPFENKENCLVLDYAEVVSSLGPVDSPKIRRKGERNKSSASDTTLKLCNECLTYNELSQKICIGCGKSLIKERSINNQYKPEQNSRILSDNKPFEVGPITSIFLSDYKSNAGNECYRIDYYYGSFFDPKKISEFFIKDKKFAIKRLMQRLDELNVSLSPGKLDCKLPKNLLIKPNGNYFNVVALNF